MVKKKKNKKNLNSVYLLFIVVFLLILILIGLFMGNLGLFEQKKEAQDFYIIDKCAIVMGNLIHQVRDEGECRVKCINECGLLDLDFEHVDFLRKDNDCNDCNCFCN
jgi:hypothetical protein